MQMKLSAVITVVIDFKLSPCFECRMGFFIIWGEGVAPSVYSPYWHFPPPSFITVFSTETDKVCFNPSNHYMHEKCTLTSSFCCFRCVPWGTHSVCAPHCLMCRSMCVCDGMVFDEWRCLSAQSNCPCLPKQRNHTGFMYTVIPDVASKQQMTALLLPTTVTCKRRQTQLSKKLTNLMGKLCCAREHWVQFFVQFFFTQLNWTV
jgi:hypothetical protein